MPCYGATEAVWCGQGRGQTFGAQTFGPLGAELSGRDARTSGSSASRHPPPLEAPSARTKRPRGCGCRLPLRERGRGRSTRQRSGLRRSSSFFSPLPREGVGGGPIITERSEASARRRPQPPERSRVAICSQPSQLLRIDHPRRGLGSICKSPLLRTARRNLFRSRLQPKRQGTRSVSVGAPPPDRRSHYDILSIFP